MKVKFITPAALRLFITTSVLAVASVTIASPSVSRGPVSISKADTSVSDQPQVTFVGSDNEYYYFRVQIGNPSERKYELTLRDKTLGSVLYSDSFTKKEFIRKVAVPRDITVLQWDLRNLSGKGSVLENIFSLSSEVKLRQDVSVTRL
jgi:hypothetical protein